MAKQAEGGDELGGDGIRSEHRGGKAEEEEEEAEGTRGWCFLPRAQSRAQG